MTEFLEDQISRLKLETERHLQNARDQGRQLQQQAIEVDSITQQLLGRLRVLQELQGEVPPFADGEE